MLVSLIAAPRRCADRIPEAGSWAAGSTGTGGVAITCRRIDAHTHIVPPDYRKWLLAKGLDAGGSPIPTWSVKSSLENMQTNEIETAILSLSTPGVEPAERRQARSIARDVNEHSAQVVKDNPKRFGFLATLTLPDVDGALAETAHAFDALGADGVVLPAHVGGVYLGDPTLDPLFNELNGRKAVVFVHPSELPTDKVKGLPPYAADFLLDTVRAAINLARSGTLDRYPAIKFLLANAGGFLPYAAWRVSGVASPKDCREDGLRLLKRFYFETALSSTRFSLPSLLAFAYPTHVVFGTDFPYAPQEVSELFTAELEGSGPDNLNAINRADAEVLFPRVGC